MQAIDKKILHLALPSIVQNITVPLLGLVDLTIVGHFGSAQAIAAIAVGSMIFNVLYWLLGFLRMGTSGLSPHRDGDVRTGMTCGASSAVHCFSDWDSDWHSSPCRSLSAGRHSP